MVGVTAVLAAGCGSSAVGTLNVSPVERAIERSTMREHGVQTAVHCPTDTPLKTGTRFECTAALSVGSYPVSVVELNARGAVHYANTTPFRVLSIDTVVLAIQGAIRREKHLASTVTCPIWILQARGLRFTCSARTKLGSGLFRVIETDSAGHIDFKGV